MKTKTPKTDTNKSVKTPQPPQVMDPSRKPVEKNGQTGSGTKPGKPTEKKLAPNEEL